MSNILFCDQQNNYDLGIALGNSKRGKCWAVETQKETPGSLEYNGRFYKRLDTFKEAEAFASGPTQQQAAK